MKFIIPIFIILILTTSLQINKEYISHQTTSNELLTLGKACSYNRDISYTKVQIYQSEIEAENTINKIMQFVSLPANFIVKASNVDNAAATILQTGNSLQRYILYNPKFINSVKVVTGNDFSGWSILAHEIGHHLSGHTLGSTSSSYKQELEADEFSGFVMYKMGATLVQSKSAINKFCDDKGSKTHPPKRLRLIAVEKGWNNAKNTSPNSAEIDGGTFDKNLVYKGTDVAMIFQSLKTGENEKQEIIGSNPILKYIVDEKKWLIIYNEPNGKLVKMDLFYIKSTDDGAIMKDQEGTMFEVINGVNKNGMLFCRLLNFSGEYFVYLSFEGLVRK